MCFFTFAALSIHQNDPVAAGGIRHARRIWIGFAKHNAASSHPTTKQY